MNSEARNLTQINEILNLAKLNENDVKPLAQTLYFTSENLYDNDFKLLQLDTYLEKEILEGKSLLIKGDDNEEVVICTDNRTFHVTEAETSNSLLLVNDIKFNSSISDEAEPSLKKIEVKGVFHEYLEAVVGKPNLKKLEKLLKASIYKGPEFEYEVNTNNLFTLDELKNAIQASDKELEDAVKSMDVIQIDKKIRLLDFEYHFRTLSYMLKLIDENSWPLDQIDFDETLEALKDLAPEEVVISLFEKYTEESHFIDGVQVYRYKEENVCKFFAQVLLYGAGKFNLNEFLQAWKESVPEGMEPDQEMLYGITIIDRNSNPNVIWAFDEKNLPENVVERFRILFEAKEKWSVPEITPYIRKLATEKVDVNALLAKYARASKVDGVKYYSSKHGK